MFPGCLPGAWLPAGPGWCSEAPTVTEPPLSPRLRESGRDGYSVWWTNRGFQKVSEEIFFLLRSLRLFEFII